MLNIDAPKIARVMINETKVWKPLTESSAAGLASCAVVPSSCSCVAAGGKMGGAPSGASFVVGFMSIVVHEVGLTCRPTARQYWVIEAETRLWGRVLYVLLIAVKLSHSISYLEVLEILDSWPIREGQAVS